MNQNTEHTRDELHDEPLWVVIPMLLLFGAIALASLSAGYVCGLIESLWSRR